jgi:hypothetical protein
MSATVVGSPPFADDVAAAFDRDVEHRNAVDIDAELRQVECMQA